MKAGEKGFDILKGTFSRGCVEKYFISLSVLMPRRHDFRNSSSCWVLAGAGKTGLRLNYFSGGAFIYYIMGCF